MEHTKKPWAAKLISGGAGGITGTDVIIRVTGGNHTDCHEVERYVSAACNAHDALVARGAELEALAQSVVDWYENAGNSDPVQSSAGSIDLWNKARAALAKVKP